MALPAVARIGRQCVEVGRGIALGKIFDAGRFDKKAAAGSRCRDAGRPRGPAAG